MWSLCYIAKKDWGHGRAARNQKQKDSRGWNVLQCERVGVIGLRQGNCGKVRNCGQIAEIRSRTIPDDVRFWANTQWTWSSGKSSAEEVTLSGQGEGENYLDFEIIRTEPGSGAGKEAEKGRLS